FGRLGDGTVLRRLLRRRRLNLDEEGVEQPLRGDLVDVRLFRGGRRYRPHLGHWRLREVEQVLEDRVDLLLRGHFVEDERARSAYGRIGGVVMPAHGARNVRLVGQRLNRLEGRDRLPINVSSWVPRVKPSTDVGIRFRDPNPRTASSGRT